MKRPLTLLVAIAGLLAASSLSRAVAQNPTPAGAEALIASGTIEEVMSDQMVRIKVSDTDTWLVEIKPGESKVEVSGTAEPAYLRSGLNVRFDGTIDKKGNLQDEIKEIEIFTPQGKNGVGLFSDKSATAKPIPKAAPGAYDIRAKINSLKEHDIALSAGAKKIFGTIAADVEVKLASDDLSYVHEGDAVKVTGWYLPANKAAAMKPGEAFADELTITLAKPLVASKKAARAAAKPAKSPRAAREAKEAKESEDGGLPIQDPFGVGAKPAQ